MTAPNIAADARFLVDRLAEVDFSLSPDDFARDWCGHIAPAIARLKSALDARASADAGQPVGAGLHSALAELYAACELRANREGGDFGPDIGPAAERAEAALAAPAPAPAPQDASAGLIRAVVKSCRQWMIRWANNHDCRISVSEDELIAFFRQSQKGKAA
jgi:hypothetical protein